MLANFIKPRLEIEEGVLSSQIKAQENNIGAFIKNSSHRPKRLLPSCIPDLKFNDLVIKFYGELSKFHSKGDCMLNLEFFVYSTIHQTTFAHSRISDNYKLVSVMSDGDIFVSDHFVRY